MQLLILVLQAYKKNIIPIFINKDNLLKILFDHLSIILKKEFEI